jgi:hypothetical protein
VTANSAIATAREAITAVNQMSGVSGTFTFGAYTVVIKNGLVTSVT